MRVGICRRCRRRLTNPKSIRRNYGPVCFKKVRKNLRLVDVLA